MNEFIDKRNSLELYVKEQLIGPGAFNNHFHFRDKLDDDDYFKKMQNGNAFLNDEEVIPEVPAYQYSTAILFPDTIICNKDEANDAIENEEEILLEPSDKNEAADDENIVSDSNESLISKQQNYPNQFGLSFVVDMNSLDKININLSYRKYRKVSKPSCFKRGLSFRITEHKNRLKEIVNEYLTDYFSVFEKQGELFIVLNKELSSKEDFYSIDYNSLNKFIEDKIISQVNKIFEIILNKEKNEDNSEKYGIPKDDDDFRNLYSISEIYGYSNVYILYEESIINEVRFSLRQSLTNYNKYKELIKNIEYYKQIQNIVNLFKAVYRKNNSLPIWESFKKEHIIYLPEYKGGNIERYPNIQITTEETHLKYSIQYLVDNSKLYVKVIVNNTNSVEIPSNKPWLNKKDSANIHSYFGVKLKVLESQTNTLVEYNPPQLLDIDEEDNLNKLLYRDFKDYGEGYNTSVNWGEENKLRYVETDFLPTQETPSVDFTPRKVNDSGIPIERLPSDSKVLSFKFLSTLSNAENDEIISELSSFIEEYKEWISEKREDLTFDYKETSLLSRQLDSCEKDYKRLNRNIDLLKENPMALNAFRLMNTAMFMQLHHNIMIQQSHEDLTKSLDEKYYKDLEANYQWRPFQLAFILLNIDGFVKPKKGDNTVIDVFGTGWPERNEIADLVWFPTGGGKTESYLGLIAFSIILRRFTHGERGYGTTVLMRYTLRLLTLQQFQRATTLIAALEVIRKENFSIPNNCSLGDEQITIGLFVGRGSLPNEWEGQYGMRAELNKIREQLLEGSGNETEKFETKLPFTRCPWCNESLFKNKDLYNIFPGPEENYSIASRLFISCNNENCSFYANYEPEENSLPLLLFDQDVYKYPPTLLFGTVDKFAALANNVETRTGSRDKDTRRFFGKRGDKIEHLPPELIIQDELHLLMGPLGSAVGLFEKGIDKLCSYKDENGNLVKPKIITSTATTRNTDKQIFALFNRRSEIFPKQGITADDSFFAFYKRNQRKYISTRKYMGILPVGKTQVWMQLRVAAITLAHRLKFIKEKITLDNLIKNPETINEFIDVFDFYHTTLSYFNSLKEVGKTQSQLNHYLPGDLNQVIKNTIPWSFMFKLLRNENEIKSSELTGRLTGDEVKVNLDENSSRWHLFNKGFNAISDNFPPEFIIATNMISVGLDISRLNTMIISSMPRGIAEYIQASSRVARNKEGIVFTIHHPFRSRDISHYQRFKEFHAKFYSYVEPISVTPFATKALDRYLPMLVITLVRHNENMKNLTGNADAKNIKANDFDQIILLIQEQIENMYNNFSKLNDYLSSEEKVGIRTNIEGIIDKDTMDEIYVKVEKLINNWVERKEDINDIMYRVNGNIYNSLFVSNDINAFPKHWKVGVSLREIAPATVIRTVQQ